MMLFLLYGCGEWKREPLVFAFYYPWYGTPEISGKWLHWNGGGHNPDIKDENGLRDIAAVHHPYPDVYDSSSTATIERHLNTAENYGIDAFILSWWGRYKTGDNILPKIFEIAQSINTKTKIAIYYEQVPDLKVENTIDEISYLYQFFENKHYLKIDGKPVLFIYGRAIFPAWWCMHESCTPETPSRIHWKSITEAFPDIIFVGDVVSHLLTPIIADSLIEDGFSAFHIYNPLLDVLLGMDIQSLYTTFTSISKSSNIISALTVIPGYDDTKTGRNITFVLERENGELYKRLWEKAISAEPDWILITSFNEWHEGTEIEESYEFGDYYLLLTQEYSNKFKNR